ncbi:MAG: hypothetical protein M1608_00400 [Candidatus Omnitrophica bacterium]|nr:hypothetical protein [Candidatus Omnitrophota bacterium]
MRFCPKDVLKSSRWLLLGGAVLLGLVVLSRAETNEVRYVEVQSLLGQVHDTAIDADDTETFGLSIPRGTALPRRMYPVRNLGVPMVQKLNQPRYKAVLLRRPKWSHTEYLEPDSEVVPITPPVSTPPIISAVIGTGRTNQTITIFWPASAADWRVESIPALVEGDLFWTPVPPSLYQTNDDSLFYVEPVSSYGSKFFRLHKP